MKNKSIIIALGAVSFVFLFIWLWQNDDRAFLPGFTNGPRNSSYLFVSPGVTEIPSVTPKPTVSPSSSILHNIAFTSQAPTGEWSDDRFQDGCEEASVYMAVAWLRGKTVITKQEARDEIIKVSSWETANYGTYHDTSAQDTADRILGGHYGHRDYQVKYNITAQDIVAELKKGNLVIIPMNGRLLGNPNYTAPGPDRHMLVVIGYDPAAKQFITNDPGTRLGKSYRYGESTFMNAIRDYPSGDHLPITAVHKAMIVVSK